MFGEDESESPRQPSPWQAMSKSPHPSSTPLAVPPSSFTRRASYLERMAIEACAQNSALALSNAGGSGIGSTPLSRVSSARELALSLEAEALKMEGQLWAGETLAPEVDEIGHIEYKLKLIAPTQARRAKLTTQLQWRLLEGGGTALYEIGVLDDGTLVGLTRTEMVESLITLESMAREIGAVATVNRVVELPEIIVRAGPVQDGSGTPGTPGSRRASSPASSSATCTISPTSVRAKSVTRRKKHKHDPLQPPPGKGKLRIQPGDAAVSSSSSDSEGDDDSTSAGERGSSTDASAARSADTSIDALSDLSTLGDALPAPPASGDDELRPPTPMERAIVRRKRRDETRAARRARLSTSTNEGDSSADSSRPGSSLGPAPTTVVEPVIKPPPTPPTPVVEEVAAQEESGPHFVIEVLVRQEREEGQAFLDFEGFGLEG